MKYLIINADDFGMSPIFNREILNLIKKDKITSTTVMVNRMTKGQDSQVGELIGLLRKKQISVGLHLEFEKDSYPEQIKSQFDKFKEIFGFLPSHIDIHKPFEYEKSFNHVIEFCKKNNLPMRYHDKIDGFKGPKDGGFFGSIEDFSKIEGWLKSLEDNNCYEILFHPGKFDPNCRSSLNKDRERDVKYINKLNKILSKYNIKKVSYLDLANSRF